MSDLTVWTVAVGTDDGTVVATHSYQGGRYLIGGEVPEPGGNRHPSIAPYRTYECSDGTIQIAVGNEPIWHRFAALVEIDPDDPRFATNADRLANSEELDRLISERLGVGTSAAWLEIASRTWSMLSCTRCRGFTARTRWSCSRPRGRGSSSA